VTKSVAIISETSEIFTKRRKTKAGTLKIWSAPAYLLPASLFDYVVGAKSDELIEGYVGEAPGLYAPYEITINLVIL
jgi:hypothetical protein